jgi:hypothetical protein
VAEKWFIERAGEVYGPADATELTLWIEEGRLDTGDMLWPEEADRSVALPAETVLLSLGLKLGGESPLVDLGDPDLYELSVVDLVDQKPAQPSQPGTPVPDWVQSLAVAVEADRRKPRPVRPDWLEDVRQAEQALRRPSRRGDKLRP